MDRVTARGLAERVLRLDGPYQPGALTAAAGLVAELVRRLNRATADPTALPQPSDVYHVVSELAAAAAGLQQLLTQLAGRLQQWGTDPGQLRHAQHRQTRDSVEFALLDLMHATADLHRAAGAADATAVALRAAHTHIGQLTLVDADGAR
ncbi:MAG: hypothetical protein IRZ05_20285 [Micromonosporaceae bacterium]|nr:hypothetical protein [Micromonosporaceae bacterium]